MTMPYIVALTGGICSGKSTIAAKFKNLSKQKVFVIDSDIISKQITQPGSVALYMITKYFGSNILFPNGTLNRYMLKKRIFFNLKDKEWLEKLLHPIIRQETQRIMKLLEHKSPYILWIVPLLIENNLQKYADRILVVDTHIDTQLHRMLNRDKINKKHAHKILESQTSRQRRLHIADDVIENNKNFDKITTQHIFKLHQTYLTIKDDKI